MAKPRTVNELVRHVQRYKRLSGITPTEVIRRLVEHIVEEGQGHTILGTFDIDEIETEEPVQMVKAAPKTVRITEPRQFVGGGKQWEIDPSLTARDINKILQGKIKSVKGGDRKTNYNWFFEVDGQPCAIWDYYGFRWSANGPKEAFAKLGIKIMGDSMGRSV